MSLVTKRKYQATKKLPNRGMCLVLPFTVGTLFHCWGNGSQDLLVFYLKQGTYTMKFIFSARATPFCANKHQFIKPTVQPRVIKRPLGSPNCKVHHPSIAEGGVFVYSLSWHSLESFISPHPFGLRPMLNEQKFQNLRILCQTGF